MGILKTKGETENFFKWKSDDSTEARDFSPTEIFEVLNKALSSNNTSEKASFAEIIEILKTDLNDIARSEYKDHLRMEAVRNKQGDIIRLRIYIINMNNGVDENLFFSDREILLNQGVDISKLYDIVKDSGVMVIEKSN